MNKYEKVKKYYDEGLWDISRVRNAVFKKWISAENFFEITGVCYK